MKPLNKSKVVNFIDRYIKAMLVFLSILFFLRAVEYVQTLSAMPDFDRISLFQFVGLVFDGYWGFAVSGFFLLPLMLLTGFIQKKYSSILLFILAVLFIVIHFSLIQYFLVTFTPLDHVFFKYSFNEIITISKSSSDKNIVLLTLFFITIASAVVLVLSKIAKKLQIHKFIKLLLILIMLFSAIMNPFIKLKRTHFLNETAYYLSINKSKYFIDNVFDFLQSKTKDSSLDEAELKKQINFYQKSRPEFEFVSKEYPLLRKNNNKDILSNYINIKETPPNLVFIVVEGLGSNISGNNASLGSFTPFLDSISQASLTWNNCFSNSERTFGVIPNIFGSLPYGNNGFLSLNYEMPPHYSLLKTLNQYDYYSSFFYGGWIHFDNMDTFFKKNDIDYIIDGFSNYQEIPGNQGDNFSWGYGDHVIYNRSLEIKDSMGVNEPFVDIYLTLSNHEPWNLNDPEKYKQMALNRISELNLSNEKVESYMHNIEVYSCLIYSDDAIRSYFKQASKKPWFNNTIFVITGDHRVHALYRETDISLYQVPLIIYSPLLKKPKSFNTISSHMNLAPTFASFISNWGIQSPVPVHWLNGSLDTSAFDKNDQLLFFMRNNKNIDQAIYKNFILNGQQLYKLNVDGNMSITKNDSVKEYMNRLTDNFSFINNYTVNHNKIVPFKDFIINSGKKQLFASYFDFNKNIPDNLDAYLIKTINKNESYLDINPDREFYSLVEEKDIPLFSDQIEFIIETEIKFNKKIPKDELPVIVFDISNNEDNIVWDSQPIFENKTGSNNWNNSINRKQLNLGKINSNITLKIYFWNKNHVCIQVKSVSIVCNYKE